MTSTLPDFNLLRTKDVQALLNVSEKLARKYLNDIREAKNIKNVLMCHFKDYFGI